MRRGALVFVVAVFMVAACAGCGVPTGGDALPVEATAVPYGLLSPASPEEADAALALPDTTAPRIYLLDDDSDLLVGVTQTMNAVGSEQVLRDLLTELEQGPGERDRDSGLASALGPDVRLRLVEVDAGTARVDVSLPTRDPAPDRLPLAVGQIVLTATSVDGVDDVVLEQSGEPVELALPGGARTSDPVGAADYAVLRADETP